MTTPSIISSVLGAVLFLGVLILVRRGRMHGSFATWWLSLALVGLFIGLFPSVIDGIGRWLGVHYPPILAVLIGGIVLTIKLLLMDMDATKREKKLRRLMQKNAILELELRQLKNKFRHVGEDTNERKEPLHSDE